MRKDTVNDSKYVQLVAPQAASTDQSGSVDTQGYENCEVIVNFGAEGITLSGTDKIEVKLLHSDTDSAYVAVAAADIVVPTNPTSATGVSQAPDTNGTVFLADGNADIPGIAAFGYVGSKRWVKATVDFSGTHGSATPVSVAARLSAPNFGPANG
jgi:hypothetical protein